MGEKKTKQKLYEEFTRSLKKIKLNKRRAEAFSIPKGRQ